jgi:hypothetical protein
MIEEALVSATQAKKLAPQDQQQAMQKMIDELEARRKS